VPGCRIVSRGTNHAALRAATFIPNYQSGPASREAVKLAGSRSVPLNLQFNWF
jgi:hypothetical protein